MKKYPASRISGFKKRWPKRSTEERFLEKVNKTETCWTWEASRNYKKYGMFWFGDGKYIRAHRASWIIFNGGIPDGLHVLHKCDNPSCVNPEHLFLGTNVDNVADSVAKGRSYLRGKNPSRGVKHPNAKLTEDMVLKIREDARKQKEIAKDFGVTRECVSSIKTRKRWSRL